MSSVKQQPAATAAELAFCAMEKNVFSKVTRHLIPFLFVLYIIAYLDRINVGLAALEWKKNPLYDPEVYGFGGGIFFFGYCLFEIPSNLILHRVGARRWIARIMITWGVISSAMMFVDIPSRDAYLKFYIFRFLLGVAEAGFFPGMILYLTYWFPTAQRARAVSRFMTATPIACAIGAPISGELLKLNGLGGLAGWQWMFLLEGLPAVALGFVVWICMTDRPAQAAWLSAEEKAWLAGQLHSEEQRRHAHHGSSLRRAFTSARVWLLTALYFCNALTIYGYVLWLPQIVQNCFPEIDDSLQIGGITMLPFVAAAIAMVLSGTHSDAARERRWHIAIPAWIGALGLVATAFLLDSPVLAVMTLCVAAMGLWSILGPFWALPTSFLSGDAAAGGIALINSIGNLGGFLGPSIIGYLFKNTGSYQMSLLILAAITATSGILALCVRENPSVD